MIVTSTSVDRVEVTVHVVSEQYVTPQIRGDDLSISTGEEIHGNSNGMSHDKDVDHGV